MAPRRVRSGEARTRQEERRAMVEDDDQQTRQYLLARFWEAALGFWRKGGGRTAWLLTFTVITIALVNLGLQYRLNVWHRAMFDALDKRDGSGVLYQSMIFFPLILASVSVAAAATYAKLTLQRRWRDWLNAHVLDQWLTSGRYYQLNLVPGDHSNPEYRMAEDLRLSVEARVEFAMGVFSVVISAITFIGVLWFIGGELTIPVGSTMLRIPGFLVIAAFVYAVLASGSMVSIARGFVVVAENKNQAEAEYRYALTRLRENGESIALLGGEEEERAGLDAAFTVVLRRWREFLGQWRRTMVVSQTSAAFVPVIPLILCAPKYVAGEMSLGPVLQVALAFVTVLVGLNWVLDSYPSLSELRASAHRFATLRGWPELRELVDRERESGL